MASHKLYEQKSPLLPVLTQDNEQLEPFLQVLSDGVTVQDAHGQILFANETAAKAMGFKHIQEMFQMRPQDILKRFEIFDHEGKPLLFEALPGRRVLKGESQSEEEICFRNKTTGEVRWSLVKASPVMNASKEVQFVINIFHDITLQKRTERNLKFQYDISANLAESVSTEGAISRVLKTFGETYVWDVGIWWSVDWDTETLKSHMFWFAPSTQKGDFEMLTREIRIKKPEDWLSDVWIKGKPMWEQNILENKRYNRRNIAKREELTSVFAVPVISGRQVIAIMEFLAREECRVDIDQLTVAESVGTVIGHYFEKKRAELALRDSEERYRKIIDLAPDVIYLIAPDKTLTMLSPAFERITGWPISECLGKPFTAIVHPEDIPLAIRMYQRSLTGEQVSPFELRIISKSGEILTGEFQSSPKYDNNRITSVLGIARDITDRKRAEDELYRREQEFEALVNNATDLIIRIDKNHHVRLVNPAITLITGLPPQEYIGKKLFDIPPFAETYQQWKKAIQFVWSFQKEKTMETKMISTEGERYYLSRIVPEINRIGTIETVLIIARDITERRQRELQREYFMSLASHELKNPLASLKAFASLVQHRMETEGDDKNKYYVSKILSSTDRINKLINDLMDIAKIRAGKLGFSPEVFDLNLLLKETIDDMKPTATHTIVFKSPRAKVLYLGDKMRIRQALTNLIVNAMKYSPQAKKVEISLKSTKKYIDITIQDYGIGIPLEEKGKIFQAFYQSGKRMGSGLGIGLYLTSEIIRYHDGELTVDSTVGKGSQFTIHLPKKNTLGN